MMTLTQVITMELIDQSELNGLCDDVRSKICKIKQAVILLESMLASVQFYQDIITCCKSLISAQNSIGEAIQSVQCYSILSSRVEGLEIGLWKLRLPFMKWINFSFANWKKKELDLLMKELEHVFEQCVFFQNSLLHILGPKFSSIQHQHEPNLIDLSNQDKWSCEIMRKEVVNSLTKAKEWNQDSLLILRNLIEWDYLHRFSVGESSKDENEFTNGFIETPESSYYSSEAHFSSVPRIFYKGSVSSNMRNPRTKRLLIFSILFASILLLCVVFVY